jgi:putative DNA primase/helicase
MTPCTDSSLQSTGRNLVEALGGTWTRRGGLCRCPAHDDRSPSLSIRVGDYGLLYHCFAGCDVGDVLRAVRAIDPHALAVTRIADHSPAPQDCRLLDRIRTCWAEAAPVAGTPAGRYLAGRGILRARDGLRFHPAVPLGRGRDVRFRPAMIAAVHDGPNLVALHRTFLEPDGSGLAADLDQSRRMLGSPGGGAVRLARAGLILGLAEGIETALSASLHLRIPVWAALGNERLPTITVPIGVRRLLILADNDAPGRRSAGMAVTAHGVPGRLVCRLWPPGGLNDWNDRLRAGGEEARGRVRQAA